MADFINEYGKYGKYVFIVCIIIFFALLLGRKKAEGTSEKRAFPTVPVIILGVLLVIGLVVMIAVLVVRAKETDGSEWYEEKMNYSALWEYANFPTVSGIMRKK